jgi:two-component system sensor histidine kinase UhpB
MSSRSRFSWRGLIPQLFILVILPLTVLLLVVTFGGLALHRQAMRTLVGQRDERAAKAAASALSDQLNQQVEEVRLIAASAPANASPEALSSLLRKDEFLLHSFDHGLAFFTPGGQQLASIGNVSGWENLIIGQESGLRGILDPDNPPGIYSSTLINEATLMLAAAPAAQDDLIAVGAFSPLTLIQHTLGNIFDSNENEAADGGTAFVVSKNHQLLFSTGEIEEASNLTTHPGVDAAIRGQTGSTFMQSGRSEHVVAYSPVVQVDWALVIEEPWTSVASPLLRMTEFAPLILIPVLLLALIALWFVTRRIIQPLQGLEAKANELAWGNYSTIEASTGGITEIRHLQAALIHLAHKVKSYQQGLRSYIGAITMGQEEERNRLARELHDDTLQSMIALNQRVQLAQLSSGQSTQQNGLAEIQSLTEQTIQNLRRLTRALRPIYLEDLGLVTALEMLARETQQASGIAITFERFGKEVRLSPPVELALYRIGQEALSNILRHARAAQASMLIRFSPDFVILEVSDNGVGFEVPDSPAEFAPGGHFGLLGMYERTEMIGAKLNIRSSPGKGSRVVVTLPIPIKEKAS